MMDNLEIYNRVREVPKEAQKEFNTGRFSGTDINPMWRIKKLTEEFGVCGFGWYYDITDKWLSEGNDGVICAFVNINLFVKIGDEWSKPIQGTGGNTFVSKNKNGLQVSDECYKMALTDAISVSAKALGIGADIYWSKDRTKYDKKPEPNVDEKPDTDEPSPVIFGMIDSSDGLEALKDVWDAYPNYQRNQKFKNAINNAKRKFA